MLAGAQVVLAVQLVLCLSCASASLQWRQAQGFSRYHLALDNFSQGAQPGQRARSHEQWFRVIWSGFLGFARYHLAMDNFSQGAQPGGLPCQRTRSHEQYLGF